jgi:hypothetical protein
VAEPGIERSLEQAEQVRITKWITETLVRYPHVFRRLRPCWAQHTYAIDALSAASETWESAYGPRGSAELRSLWLDRWLVALERQLSHALGECSSGHEPDRVDLAKIGTG